jgi:hypothetical protein
MAVESQILGIPISSISKIAGKSKDQIEKIFDQPAPVLGLRAATITEAALYAAPTISISRDSGEYDADTLAASAIQLTSNKSNTVIYYTLDGATPTIKSLRYDAGVGISITEAKTLKYIAVATKTLKTSTVTKTYTVSREPDIPQLAAPTFSVRSDDEGNDTVTMTALDGANIYYTIDGSKPTTNSQKYSSPIQIMANTNKTVKALATKSGYTDSGVTTSIYGVTILGTLEAPRIQLSGTTNEAGEYISSVSVTISDRNDGIEGVSIYYTTDDSTPTTSSTLYDRSIVFSATDSIRAKAFASGYRASDVARQDFTIGVATQVATPTITISGAAVSGTYTGDQTISFASSTSGVTFYYTTNGTTPTISSTSGTSFTTAGSATVKVLAVKTNYTNSAVATASYTIKVPTPAFGSSTGTYTNDQSITLSNSLSGATILYKLGAASFGTYTSAFNTSGTGTYTAYSTKSGYTDSDEVSATYTIKLTAPTISVASGTFDNDFNVTISGPAGSTIRYTLNGNAPDSNSSIYSGAISINGTKTLKTIAQKNGYSDSNVSTGAYTLVVADPEFNPGDGSTVLLGSTVKITSNTSGATIKYTTDGSDPKLYGTVYSRPIEITE